jgi:hypothetical protein
MSRLGFVNCSGKKRSPTLVSMVSFNGYMTIGYEY